jgi:hypothetical protein
MNININDNILAEIGKITITFNLIENSLSEIIIKIVTVGNKKHELGSIITAELSFKQLISTLRSLLLFTLGKSNSNYLQFQNIAKLLFKAEQERNIVVHSIWATKSGSNTPNDVVRIKTTAKYKKGLHKDFIKMNLVELQKISNLIGEAYKELCLFELNFQE